jgi:hypothetical protein
MKFFKYILPLFLIAILSFAESSDKRIEINDTLRRSL